MKIKFRALCLTALVVVLAFASVASAAKFVGIDSQGNFELITVKHSETEPEMTYTDLSTLPNMKKNDGWTTKLYTYPGGMVAISADVISSSAVMTSDEITFLKVDGDTVSLNRTFKPKSFSTYASTQYAASKYAGVRTVLTSGDNLIFVSDQVFGVYDAKNNEYTKKVTSIDTAFVYNDSIYVIGHATISDDMPSIYEVSGTSLSEGVKLKGVNMKAKTSGVSTSSVYASAVVGNSVYFGTETGLFKMVGTDLTKSGIIFTGNVPEIKKTTLEDEYIAMVAADDKLYALKSADAKVSIVSIAPDDADREEVLYADISADVKFMGSVPKDTFASLDIYYDADDQVFAVVHHGVDTQFYEKHGTSFRLLEKPHNTVYLSVAPVVTASSSGGDEDSKGETTTTTVVDATKLTNDQKANLKNETGGEAADFVTTAVEGTGTTPDSTVTANVRSAAGTGYENATVAPVRNYTLASDGYLLVTTNPGYNAANVKVFFVPVSSSSSTSAKVAADLSENGVLLDSSYAKASGTSAYAASTEKLTAGTYTLVTATKTSSTTPEDEGSTTSSSSGGCDAGFGLWSLAALMAVSTLSKRR